MKNKIFLLGLFIAVSFSVTKPLQAQWLQTNGPYGWNTSCFAVSGPNIFAGTAGGGVFHSTNNGSSWTAVSTGLPENGYIYSLAVSESNLFAGTIDGVFLSTDYGTSWTAVNTGLPVFFRYVLSLAVSGSNLFTCILGGGVYLSADNGSSWTLVTSGLTNTYVRSFAVSGPNIFAGTGGGVFLSTNNGTNWTEVNTGLTNTNVYSLAVSGQNLFAGTYGGGVFLSTDYGTNWTEVNTGLTNTDVRSLAVSGSNLFAGTYGGGVYRSADNGSSWTEVNSDLTNTDVRSLAVSGSNLFAGTYGGGVFLSTNDGTNWSAVNSGMTIRSVSSLTFIGTNLFAGSGFGGVFLSTNDGTSWTVVNSGLTNTYVTSLAVSGQNLFAGIYSGGVFLSTDYGTSWNAVNSGLTNTYVTSLTVSGTNIFVGTEGGVFLSTNDGTSWTDVNTGIPVLRSVLSLAVSGSNLFAGTGDGVFLSTNNGTNWTEVNTGLTDHYGTSLAVIGTNHLFLGNSSGVFLSTDYGTSWNAVNSGLTNTDVRSFAVYGSKLFAGTFGGGVFLSTNYGSSWTAFNTGLTSTKVYSLAVVNGTNLFAGTELGGVWRNSIAPPLSPSVSSVAPTAYSYFADIHFSINPNGSETTYQVRYGTTSGSYQNSFPTPPISAGNGSSLVPKKVYITGLTEGNTYFYSVQATNSNGTTNSSEQSFTTPQPISTAPNPTVSAGQTGSFPLGATGASVTFTTPSGTTGSIDASNFNFTPPGTPIPAVNVLPRYWTITNTGLTSYRYNILLDLSSLMPINFNTLTFYKRANSSAAWVDVKTLGATVTINPPFVLISGLTSFSDFGIGSDADTPLPVELSEFSGSSINEHAKLNWKTQSEENNAGFVVLRDGNEIASYQTNPTLRGAGTTSSANSYSYTDQSVEVNKSYAYKLRSIDLNGTIHDYPKVVSVKVEANIANKVYEYELKQNYPNPFNPTTTIQFTMKQAGVAKLRVYDLLGRVVVNETIQATLGENFYKFNGANIGSGVYFYELQAGATNGASSSFTQTKKMVLIK